MRAFLTLCKFPLLVTMVLVASACTAAPTVEIVGVLPATPTATPPEVAAPPEAGPTPAQELPDTTQGTVELEPGFLGQAAARTSEASSLRFEGFFEDFGFGSRTEPHVVGEVDGDLARTSVDRTDFSGDRVAALATGQDDLTITIVTEGQNAFVTSPYFKLFVDAAGISDASYAWVEEVATGWGRVELNAVPHGDIVGTVDIGTGPRGTDLLGLLDQGRDVIDGGASEVRGVATEVFYTDVTFRAANKQLGDDPEQISLSEVGVERLDDVGVEIEVHIDADGFIRRIEYSTDYRLVGGFQNSWQRVDYFDFGAETNVTAPLDWVDITTEIQDLTS